MADAQRGAVVGSTQIDADAGASALRSNPESQLGWFAHAVVVAPFAQHDRNAPDHNALPKGSTGDVYEETVEPELGPALGVCTRCFDPAIYTLRRTRILVPPDVCAAIKGLRELGDLARIGAWVGETVASRGCPFGVDPPPAILGPPAASETEGSGDGQFQIPSTTHTGAADVVEPSAGTDGPARERWPKRDVPCGTAALVAAVTSSLRDPDNPDSDETAEAAADAAEASKILTALQGVSGSLPMAAAVTAAWARLSSVGSPTKAAVNEVAVIECGLLTVSSLEAVLTQLYRAGCGDQRKRPLLLQDMVTSPELERLLPPNVIRVLTLVIGRCVGANLRNLLWHGFLLGPTTLPRPWLHLLGRVLGCLATHTARVAHRAAPEKCSDAAPTPPKSGAPTNAAFPGVEWFALSPDTLCADASSAEVLALVRQSLIVPHGCTDVVFAVLQWPLDGLPSPEAALGDAATVLCVLETLIRQLFVAANRLDPSTTQADSLPTRPHYTTFVTALAKHLDSGAPNIALQIIGAGIAEFLQDVLVCPKGPRVRDRIAHGEVEALALGLPRMLRIAAIAVLAKSQAHLGITHAASRENAGAREIDAAQVKSVSEGRAAGLGTCIGQCVLAVDQYRSQFHPTVLAQQTLHECSAQVAGWATAFPPADPVLAAYCCPSMNEGFATLRETVGRAPLRLREACTAALAEVQRAVISLLTLHSHHPTVIALDPRDVRICFELDPWGSRCADPGVRSHEHASCRLFRVEKGASEGDRTVVTLTLQDWRLQGLATPDDLNRNCRMETPANAASADGNEAVTEARAVQRLCAAIQRTTRAVLSKLPPLAESAGLSADADPKTTKKVGLVVEVVPMITGLSVLCTLIAIQAAVGCCGHRGCMVDWAHCYRSDLSDAAHTASEPPAAAAAGLERRKGSEAKGCPCSASWAARRKRVAAAAGCLSKAEAQARGNKWVELAGVVESLARQLQAARL